MCILKHFLSSTAICNSLLAQVVGNILKTSYLFLLLRGSSFSLEIFIKSTNVLRFTIELTVLSLKIVWFCFVEGSKMQCSTVHVDCAYYSTPVISERTSA